MAMTGKNGGNNVDPGKMKQVQVYRSYFKDDGYLDFIPLIKRPFDVNALYRLIYRHVMNLDVKKINRTSELIGEGIFNEISGFYSAENLSHCLEVLQKDLVVLDEFVNLIRAVINNLHLIVDEVRKDSPDIYKIKELWQKIEPMENEIEMTGHTHPCFRPLTLLFMYSKETLEGNDLQVLSEKSLDKYGDLLIKFENMQLIVLRLTEYMNNIVKDENIAIMS